MSEVTNHIEDGDTIIPIFGSVDAIDFHDQESREEFNELFDSITDEARTPEIIFSELATLLNAAGYTLPKPTTFNPDDEIIFALHADENDPQGPEYFYFAHSVVYEDGGSEIHAELMTEEELENLFDDIDE